MSNRRMKPSHIHQSDFLLIVNPTAGKGRARLRAGEAYRHLTAAGLSGEMVFTRRRGDGARLAAEGLAQGVPRIIACGGDGTIHEVVNVLAYSEAILGILPGGKGNDLARALGIPHHPIAAAGVILSGTVRTIDLGRLNDRYFSTIAALGFDAEVSRQVNEMQMPFAGVGTYLYAALKTLWHYQCPHIRLTGDFGRFEGDIFLTATGNSSSYGGGLQILPPASLDDGVLDVCIIKAVPRRTILRMFPTVFWGGHTAHPAVTITQTRHLSVESPTPLWFFADGEPICSTPASIEVAAGALRVFATSRRG
ncbi:MAG: diacylglycerol kinase family lipid kinase [Nitrospinota bacterium]|nr:MAG: diacylglycerol kinase family lipid kinase [Nitrospinota bacterium]